MSPAADSSTRFVTGSTASSMPVSSSTVATQIVLLPDITGYSIDSMITKPGDMAARLAEHQPAEPVAVLGDVSA
jgi:hypothetical protein